MLHNRVSSNMSFPHTKDIDEIKFHSTEKERQNELAVKLYAHQRKLKAIADAYDEQVSGALGRPSKSRR